MSDDASKHRDSCRFQFHEIDCRPVYIVSGSLGCSGNDYDALVGVVFHECSMFIVQLVMYVEPLNTVLLLIT